MSKGSRDRVTDKKKFDENYNGIDWSGGIIRYGESLDDAAARHFLTDRDWWDRTKLDEWDRATKGRVNFTPEGR